MGMGVHRQADSPCALQAEYTLILKDDRCSQTLQLGSHNVKAATECSVRILIMTIKTNVVV